MTDLNTTEQLLTLLKRADDDKGDWRSIRARRYQEVDNRYCRNRVREPIAADIEKKRGPFFLRHEKASVFMSDTVTAWQIYVFAHAIAALPGQHHRMAAFTRRALHRKGRTAAPIGDWSVDDDPFFDRFCEMFFAWHDRHSAKLLKQINATDNHPAKPLLEVEYSRFGGQLMRSGLSEQDFCSDGNQTHQVHAGV